MSDSAAGVRRPETGSSSSDVGAQQRPAEPTPRWSSTSEAAKAPAVASSGAAPSTSPLDTSATSGFDCNICLETPQDPVVTLCGHLFCWACLYRWLRRHAQSNECPVCKAGVEEDKVVPLYGRGKAQADPRTRPVPEAEVPQRPIGQRPEPVRHGHARQDFPFGFFPGVGGPFASAQMGGFTVSAGFGLFPALFGWHFPLTAGYHPGNMPPYDGYSAGRQGPPVRSTPAEEQNQFLSRLLLALGVFVMMAIVFS